MFQSRKKKSLLKRLLLNQVVLAVLGLIIIVAISLPLARNLSKRYTINKEINNLKNEITGLQNKNEELAKLLDYLDSDEFAEEQARLNLNYQKEGEEMVIVNDQTVDSAGGHLANNSLIGSIDFSDRINSKGINNPARWWLYFMSHR